MIDPAPAGPTTAAGLPGHRQDDALGLRAFANVNPFTIVIDAMRHLWIGGPAGNSVWGAVATAPAAR